MSRTQKAPTIQDVARYAHVSTATVSRSLSAPERVSEGTRARVIAAVQATGYRLNQTARSLRKRSARTILVALPDIRNPFFSSILDAIEREAARRGYGVLVANLFLGKTPVERLQDYLLSNRADGLILLDGTIALSELESLTAAPHSVPLVVACEEIPRSDFPTVITDNIEAAKRATDHLIGLGHRRIGHLLGPERNIIARDRRAGFSEALNGAGLDLVEDWVLPGEFTIEGGLAAAARFMALPDRPTAVFAANDESAIGFLSGLRQHGILCPRDISVVGFDDLAVAAHYTPALTSVHQPREQLGTLAAATLIDRLEGRQAATRAPLRTVLRSDLIIRQSTGRPQISRPN